jgi:transcriptional regulator of acetoin/glycerol metabolism
MALLPDDNKTRAVPAGTPGLTHSGHVGLDPWIERSWQRCLAQGKRPGDHLVFDAVSSEMTRRVVEASRHLLLAARPVLGQLAHAMAHTRYFAILTNADGIVVDVNGPVDHNDRRANLITRVGVDLSERAVGTTAIGVALGEQQPVWLHRGEHFYADNSAYSCAGAPVFGPNGQCVGMLDLTGIDAPERPELKHLVSQCAQRIENGLLRQQPFALLVRLSWPQADWGMGGNGGGESDGLIGVDNEGFVTGSNTAARQMLPQLNTQMRLEASNTHCSDLFAMPWESLFDAALLGAAAIEVPLWSGLRLQALPLAAEAANRPHTTAPQRSGNASLREVETVLIRKAVDQAKGNVAQAARALGISRATVYRKLSSRAT